MGDGWQEMCMASWCGVGRGCVGVVVAEALYMRRERDEEEERERDKEEYKKIFK